MIKPIFKSLKAKIDTKCSRGRREKVLFLKMIVL